MKSIPLTENRLIKILKDMNLATKGDLKNFATKDDVNSAIVSSERIIIRKIGQVKNDLAGRIANLALTTPTIREFEKLKQEVAN